MSAKRFTVTHANGTQSVRTSKTMTYTHAVEVAETGAYRAARALESAEHCELMARREETLAARQTDPAEAAEYLGYAAGSRARAEHYRAVAERELHTPTTYGVVRWSQTQQAAEKDARNRQAPGYTATVVTVD